MMRVLLLTTSFPLSKNSSSGIFIKRLARQLGKSCELRVLAPSSNEKNEQLMVDDEAYVLSEFRYAPKGFQLLAHRGGGIPATLRALPASILLLPFFVISMFISCWYHGRNVDVIYANWSVCGLVAGLVGLIVRRPVVTTIRGEDANRSKSSTLYRFILKSCLTLSTYTTAVSNDIAESLMKVTPEKANCIFMIPNGVESFASENRRDLKRDDTIRICMVGSLIPRKSVHTAIEAVALLPSHYHLHIAGDGLERVKLESLAEKKSIRDRVHFIGRVSPEEISRFLGDSDLYIITSITEGRPNTVLEACAACLPVVASEIPGIIEIVRHGFNGLLFPVGDYQKLAENISKMTEDDRRRFGINGASLVNELGLTWENSARLYLDLFKKASTKGLE